MNRKWLIWGLVAIVCTVTAWSLAQAEFDPKNEFEASETIDSLTVRITIGAQGDDLEEPVALDLGLGFPLWLHPLGREASESPPFGAVAQQGTAGAKIAAGSEATFTFHPEGEAGQDSLLSTSQLLAGTQVSDIARIGFCAQGTGNWVLAGYELKINGRAFAVNDQIDLKARETQDTARFNIAELGLKISPLEREASDLKALVEAELAEEADVQRLADVQAELAPLQLENRRLQGQIEGKYPLFEESPFESPWREKSGVDSVNVTLVTDTHTGAGTHNYVYFRTGGHKYLLSTPTDPLSGELGSQAFELDLLAGPLTAADLRGHAVGMLAHGQPYADAPDRWHPQRILVEIDQRVVYDSDESPIDRNSLEAIRVIPPAHLDDQSKVVVNTPTSRETFVWEAGKALGIDLAEGGALPLPPPEDPGYPQPEPLPDGMADDGGIHEGHPGDENDFPPGFDPFPGEHSAGGSGWPLGPGAGGPPVWFDWIVGWLLQGLGVMPPGVIPPPAGSTFQIDSAAITDGWKLDDTFTIKWTVSGDEGEIDHYAVSLIPVYPDQPAPYGPAIVSGNVAVGGRQFSSPLPAFMIAPTPRFFAPIVVAIPNDPAATSHEMIGPAKAVFPVGTNPLGQPQLDSFYTWTHPPVLIFNADPVSLGGEPAGLVRAVWPAGQVTSHNAIRFDNSQPGWNLGVRSEPGDEVTARFLVPFLTGKNRVLAYVGFLGGSGGGNAVDVALRCELKPAPGAIVPAPAPYLSPTVNLVNPAAGAPAPMKIIEMVVDRADAPWFGQCQLQISLEFKGGAIDPNHPPALIGLQMVPEP